ncbi:unnamed protein product [Rhizophagus irregularis]|nr:unnamed protein product [Rhizophagus irregularis]CAB5393210.1 unnamed protein product [Rhizophagus irregularis]
MDYLLVTNPKNNSIPLWITVKYLSLCRHPRHPLYPQILFVPLKIANCQFLIPVMCNNIMLCYQKRRSDLKSQENLRPQETR